MALQGWPGLHFLPYERIAMVQDEGTGRLMVVGDDGAVAHRPGPLEGFDHPPWIRVGRSLVHPGFVRRERQTVGARGRPGRLPGGWTVPLPASWPKTSHAGAPPDPVLDPEQIRASDVWFVRAEGEGATWVTRRGEVAVHEEEGLSWRESLLRHPYLVAAGRVWINVRALRHIRLEGARYILDLGGTSVSISFDGGPALARRLGLPDLHHVGPLDETQQALYALGLRDFPEELFMASAESLRAWFGDDLRAVVANVIWQTVRLRAQGRPPDYGRDHRGFWYRPLRVILCRLGFAFDDGLGDAASDRDFRASGDPQYLLYTSLLTEMVGERRLITYHDLGFEEPRPDLRAVGSTHPEVLLMAEKESLRGPAMQIGQEYGVSVAVVGGQPSYLAAEFLATALRSRTRDPLLLVAFVDFDPEGWSMPESFTRQLGRFGVDVSEVRHLVVPGRFTRVELDRLAEPLSAQTASGRTRVKNWLARSHGIHGKALGIHADHLRPYERVRDAFEEETGLAPIPRAGELEKRTVDDAGSEETPRERADLIYLQDAHGIVLVPLDQVALVRDEGTGRLEVTSAEGRVAHRPGPFLPAEDAPFIEIAPGVWVHPAHARQHGQEIRLPGGWRIPWHGRLPAPPAITPSPWIASAGVRADEVLYLSPRTLTGRRGTTGNWWMTDGGRVPVRGSLEDAAREHGGLVPAGSRFVNPRRIRVLERARNARVVFDQGTVIQLTNPARHELYRALGIPSLDYLARARPGHTALYEWGLRDWPFEIAEATEAELREAFGGDETRIDAHLAWQTVRMRARGDDPGYGRNHRGFWYHPLEPVLRRAGVLTLVHADGDATVVAPNEQARRFFRFEVILTEMVGESRLFTYEDLGFEDPRPDQRCLGATHPWIVLVVEKDTLGSDPWRLADHFGVSLIILGGAPTLIATEYLVGALRDADALRGHPVQVVALADYDHHGWANARAILDQFARYGVATDGHVRFLVRPSRFTARELEMLSVPLRPKSAANRTLLARWMEDTGGIDGQARGIQCDHLRPLERLVAAFREEMGAMRRAAPE